MTWTQDEPATCDRCGAPLSEPRDLDEPDAVEKLCPDCEEDEESESLVELDLISDGELDGNLDPFD